MRARTLVAVVFLALSASSLAQVRTQWSGSVSLRTGLEATGAFTSAGVDARLLLDGEMGSAFVPTAAFRAELRTDADAATGAASIDLGDAWGRLYLADGDVELTVGRQRPTWGSTDGVNPVDRLTPRDLSVPVDATKISVPMLHMRSYLDHDLQLEVALLPVFVPSVPPGDAWRSEPVVPTPRPGMSVREVLPADMRTPEAALENLQVGARAQWRPPGFDVAVSYQYLFRDLPTTWFDVQPTEVPGEVTVQAVARYDRIHVLGVDGSTAIGDVVVRVEAAYVFTGDPDGTDPTVGNHAFQAVAGFETPIPDGPRVIAQVILDGERRDARPGQERGDMDLSLRSMLVARHDLDARTRVDAAWVHGFDGSGSLRPSVTHTFADGVSGTLEGLVFYGGDGTRFGDWRERSGLEASLGFAF